MGLRSLVAAVVAEARPGAYPNAVFAGMRFRWETTSRAARYDLAGNHTAWLRAACREREIEVPADRNAAIEALVAWQRAREDDEGWTR